MKLQEEQIEQPDTTPLVTIRCITYNHEPYIRQCLEGFVMQKTTFPFEAVVHDDASTDGTAAIIREYAERYPDIIRPIYETENQYSKHDGSLRRIMDAHMRGKYIALCEGDDYWTDPLKLQKQVDFLEGHPEYVMSHTSIQYYYHEQRIFVKSKDVEINSIRKDCVTAEDILFSDRYRIQTLTVVYRKEIKDLVSLSDPFLYGSGHFLQGDTPLWYGLLQHGKIHFLPEVTAVYRKNDGSLTATKSIKKRVRFMLSYAELRMYLLHRDNLYSIEDRVNRIYARKLLCYKAFNPDYVQSYYIDIKKYAKFYYYLYRLGLLSTFLLVINSAKSCLRPWKNKILNSI